MSRMSGTPSFEVIAGTYEEFLLGYNFLKKERRLVQSFAAHDHTSSIRCVAKSGHYLASGGVDDRIFVYDLKARKEHCSLTHHNATVTCLQFTSNQTHLISGSSDGVLAIVRVGNWQLEKVWEKAHKGSAVLDIAIHPTGKLALTLGADFTLCTWNLIKGRQAYIINLNSKCKQPKSLEGVKWAEDGVRFVLYGGNFVEVWSIETGHALKQIEHKVKVTSCAWFDEDNLLVGHEDGHVSLVHAKGKFIKVFKAHDNRVKGITFCKKRMISVCSGGHIKVWNGDLEEVAAVDTGCRLTCLSVITDLAIKQEIADDVSIQAEDEVEEIEDHAQEVEVTDKSEEIKSKRQKRAPPKQNNAKTENKGKHKKKSH